jgi:hypothetical protein
VADTSLIFNILARNKTGKAFRELSNTAKVAFAVAGVAAVKFGADSISAASDLAETRSKVGVIFGDQATAVEAFASRAGKALGQSEQSALDAAATFATFGKGAGLSGKDLTGFSTDLTTLASDMASFSNTTPEQAIEAIGAALRGESEPIRKYGVLLDDATLRNQALALGLVKTTKQALTPQQKVLAAQAAIMKQTTAAQGDFERTSGGLANQQRIMAAEFDNASAKLGSSLLPAATTFATFATSTLIPAFSGIIDFVTKNSDVILPLVGIVGTLVAGIKVWTIAQAALNIVLALNPIGLVVIAIAALVAGIVIAYQRSETFRNIVTAAWNGIKAAALGVVNWFKNTAWPVIKWVIDAVVGYYKFLWTTFSNVVKWILDKGATLSQWFRELPGKIGGFFSGIADTIKTPFRIAFNAIASLWNNTVGRLSFSVPSWVPGIGGNGFSMPTLPMLAKGGTAVSAGLALVGENGPELLRMPRGASVIPLDSNSGGTTSIVVNVTPAPGERAEESVPRAMRRTIFELGLGGI